MKRVVTTKVINIKDRGNNKDYVYIGRPSPFGNPFIIGIDGTRDQVIEKYLDYFIDCLHTKKGFREEVERLKDKTLGCFCKPDYCHGDIIAHWLDNEGN